MIKSRTWQAIGHNNKTTRAICSDAFFIAQLILHRHKKLVWSDRIDSQRETDMRIQIMHDFDHLSLFYYAMLHTCA
jgi:hypothetical protein